MAEEEMTEEEEEEEEEEEVEMMKKVWNSRQIRIMVDDHRRGLHDGTVPQFLWGLEGKEKIRCPLCEDEESTEEGKTSTEVPSTRDEIEQRFECIIDKVSGIDTTFHGERKKHDTLCALKILKDDVMEMIPEEEDYIVCPQSDCESGEIKHNLYNHDEPKVETCGVCDGDGFIKVEKITTVKDLDEKLREQARDMGWHDDDLIYVKEDDSGRYPAHNLSKISDSDTIDFIRNNILGEEDEGDELMLHTNEVMERRMNR